MSHRTEARRCGHGRTTTIFTCGCQPEAEEGIALLEQAAGQGHAYAMHALGWLHLKRKDFILTVEWFTKGAEARLPQAMHMLGHCLDVQSVADYPAAAGWYRRAADAGDADSANNLSAMYSVGRGRGLGKQSLPRRPPHLSPSFLEISGNT